MDTVDPVILIEMYRQIAELSQKFDATNSLLQRWLPAAVGVLSAIAAIVVGLISRNTIKKQIIASKEIAQDQIATSKEVALAQLEASKEQVVRQLRATVVATSRREWIELLRDKISEFISVGIVVHENLIRAKEPSADIASKFILHRTYIELMLNEVEESHKAFLSALDEFNEACAVVVSEEEAKNEDKCNERIDTWKNALKKVQVASRKVMKAEWEKVKTLE